jgi:hypothetical protein
MSPTHPNGIVAWFQQLVVAHGFQQGLEVIGGNVLGIPEEEGFGLFPIFLVQPLGMVAKVKVVVGVVATFKDGGNLNALARECLDVVLKVAVVNLARNFLLALEGFDVGEVGKGHVWFS